MAGTVPLLVNDRLKVRGSPGRMVGSSDDFTPCRREKAGWTATDAQPAAAAEPTPLIELVAVPDAQFCTPAEAPPTRSSGVTLPFRRPWRPRVAAEPDRMVPLPSSSRPV